MANVSPTTPSPSSNTKRNPPPTLFKAPTNNSSVSLTSLPSTGLNQRAPLVHSRTVRGPEVSSLKSTKAPQSPALVGQSEDNRVDALWAKMQLTLEEVELSALGSTHVFGNAHNAALEELRDAQIGLARAWGRGEADEDFEAEDGAVGLDDEAKGNDEGKKPAEEGEDEGDVREARRRREANERFFKKVGEGVADVVGKLGGVAAAMAKVEKESREIWDERESIDESSIAS